MASRGPATQEGGRIRVVLSCTVCGNRNYRTKKAPREGGPALKLKKFCSSCQHHTVHIEGR